MTPHLTRCCRLVTEPVEGEMSPKKILRFLVVSLLLICPSIGLAAVGTVTQTPLIISDSMREIVFVCIGGTGGETGTIPDTTTDATNTSFIVGWYPYRIVIENLAADSSVDNNADVYLKDAWGNDVLGGQGVDQLDDNTKNYIRLSQYDAIVGALTLSVANQTQASGKWTITVIFVK
jgi:hypothetical protein